jgi:hemerythrin-like metal-binding protein
MPALTRQDDELMELAERFVDACAAGARTQDELIALFEATMDRARTHFIAEEALMAHVAYPEAVPHRQRHVKLMELITRQMFELRTAQEPVHWRSAQNIRDVIVAHCTGPDVAFHEFLAQRKGAARTG